MAELADALDLGSSAIGVKVQILSPAPIQFLCGSGSVVERRLAKANVASSNLVFRSIETLIFVPAFGGNKNFKRDITGTETRV